MSFRLSAYYFLLTTYYLKVFIFRYRCTFYNGNLLSLLLGVTGIVRLETGSMLLVLAVLRVLDKPCHGNHDRVLHFRGHDGTGECAACFCFCLRIHIFLKLSGALSISAYSVR